MITLVTVLKKEAYKELKSAIDKRGLKQNQKLVAYSIDPDISDEERRDIIEMVKIAMKNRRRV